MSPEKLSLRINPENPNHHLWDNHGTWWIHYTLNTSAGRIRRVRRSLRTNDPHEATVRRDELLTRLAAEGVWVS